MKANMELGTAKIDITPSKPLPLAGFLSRNGNFEGIANPLYARIFLFQQDSENGAKKRALYVSADLVWWGSDRIDGLKKVLANIFHLEETAIILQATHTHSGPQTTALFTPSLGELDEKYVEYLESQLVRGIREAETNIEPVTISMGTGKCHVGINRRKSVDGKVQMLPNPDGPLDEEITVVCFTTKEGKKKGVFVHFTCHPTTTDENIVSPEFPGAAMERVEKTLNAGAVAAFLQGCCGDIRPALIQDGKFYKGTQKDIDELGERIAGQVLSILHDPLHELSPSVLENRMVQVCLPFRSLPSQKELETRKTESAVLAEWSSLLLDNPERLKPGISFEMSYLRLAEGLSLLAMNGEVVVEYGLYIKKMFDGKVLPLSYSNGMIGYVPTAEQVLEGGYESMDSTYFFGLPSEFSTDVESNIHSALKEIKKHTDRLISGI